MSNETWNIKGTFGGNTCNTIEAKAQRVSPPEKIKKGDNLKKILYPVISGLILYSLKGCLGNPF